MRDVECFDGLSSLTMQGPTAQGIESLIKHFTDFVMGKGEIRTRANGCLPLLLCLFVKWHKNVQLDGIIHMLCNHIFRKVTGFTEQNRVELSSKDGCCHQRGATFC